VRDYPAVSVLLATVPGPRMQDEDAARLDALLTQATTRLAEELGSAEAALLGERLRALAAEAARCPMRSGLALYASSQASSSWALSSPVRDRAVIDPTYATRDLVRSLHRTPRHVVLVITDRDARLFDSSGDRLAPAMTRSFPISRVGRAVTTGRGAPNAEGGSNVRASSVTPVAMSSCVGSTGHSAPTCGCIRRRWWSSARSAPQRDSPSCPRARAGSPG